MDNGGFYFVVVSSQFKKERLQRFLIKKNLHAMLTEMATST
jgi:hypothetical protein